MIDRERDRWGFFSRNWLRWLPRLASPKSSGQPAGSRHRGVDSWCVSCSVVSDSLRPHGLQPARLCPWNSSGKNTGVGSHSLLQGFFPTQGLNLGLRHCRKTLYSLNHQGSPKYKIRAKKTFSFLVTLKPRLWFLFAQKNHGVCTYGLGKVGKSKDLQGIFKWKKNLKKLILSVHIYICTTTHIKYIANLKVTSPVKKIESSSKEKLRTCAFNFIYFEFFTSIYSSIQFSSVAQSCPTLCDPMIVAHQAPLSKEFPKQENWSG